jgi:hypothetical protein
MDTLADPLDVPGLAPDPAALGARIIDLSAGASLDVSARDMAADAICRAHLAPGTPVHIVHTAADTTPGIVAAAARLRAPASPRCPMSRRAAWRATRG